MLNVRFKKIKNNHDRLRDDVIEGVTPIKPEVGKSFIMFGEGKEFGTRQVTTSLIEKVEQNDTVFTLTTESGSIYEVEYLSE